MIRELITLFILKLTILGNQQLYSFKSSKIFNKLFKNISYDNKVLIYILAVYNYIKKLLKLLLLNCLLIFVLLFVPILINDASGLDVYTGYLFLIPLLVILSSKTFKANEEKYNFVRLLRYDAKKYCLVDILKYLIMTLIITIPMFWFICYSLDYSSNTFWLLFSYYANFYLFSNLLFLYVYEKRNIIIPELGNKYLILLVTLGIMPIILAFFKYDISFEHLLFFNILVLLFNVVLLGWYRGTKVIQRLYKENFSSYLDVVDDDNAFLSTMENRMKINTRISNKVKKETGYKMFNDLFMERHDSILRKNVNTFAILLLVLFGILTVSMVLYSPLKVGVAKVLNYSYFTIMYIVFLANRGQDVTRAMFFHCDQAMLKYNFYRNKKNVWELFKLRLFSLIKINMPLTLILTLGLLVVYVVCLGFNLVNLFFIIVATFLICNFFSLYYLALYYLIQPYSKDMKERNFKFNLIIGITYYLIYFVSNNFYVNLLLSTSLIIVFVLVISSILLFLVNKYADKTFKLRNE